MQDASRFQNAVGFDGTSSFDDNAWSKAYAWMDVCSWVNASSPGTVTKAAQDLYVREPAIRNRSWSAWSLQQLLQSFERIGMNQPSALARGLGGQAKKRDSIWHAGGQGLFWPEPNDQIGLAGVIRRGECFQITILTFQLRAAKFCNFGGAES